MLREGLADLLDALARGPLRGVVAALAWALEGRSPWKLLRAALLFAFAWPGLGSPEAWAAQLNWRLFVWVHEGGHGVFMFCNDWNQVGRFLCIAGGSAAQVALPALFVVAAWSVGQRFSAALLMNLVALNLASVGWYAADAQQRAMPLIFNLGPESHDWGNLLLMTGLLPWTPAIAGFISGLAYLSWAFGLGLALWAAEGD